MSEMKYELAVLLGGQPVKTEVCSKCGKPAHVKTYYQEQTRYEVARILEPGVMEVIESNVKVDGEVSDEICYCDQCFGSA